MTHALTTTMALTKADKNKIEEEEKYRRAVAASISSRKDTQKHGVPLILSVFIPGLGQIIKGQVKKGFLIFFTPSIAFVIFLLLGFLDNNGSNVLALFGYIWFGGITFYVWQLYDAYNN
jgi:TM2 domain-containing membrane protein YozV